MNAKITLYSDKETIKKIKEYSKKHNVSISKLVNQFFKSLLKKESKVPITSELSGILKDFDVNEEEKQFQIY